MKLTDKYLIDVKNAIHKYTNSSVEDQLRIDRSSSINESRSYNAACLHAFVRKFR